jgi:hypothetical protein
MWVAVHGFTGMALGAWSPLGLGLTIVAAIVLHLLLDMVPHWDYTRHRRRVLWAALDLGVTAVAFLVAGLTLTDGLSVVIVGFVSALPDLDVFDAIKPGNKRRRWFPSHWSRFPHGTASPAVGIPLQVILVLASLVTVTAGSA